MEKAELFKLLFHALGILKVLYGKCERHFFRAELFQELSRLIDQSKDPLVSTVGGKR